MKKICFITTSRADFGTLDQLIEEVKKKNYFKVQLIISGSHTNKIYGNTKNEVKITKKCTIKKIKINTHNKNSKSVALSFSHCVNKFSEALSNLKPDLFVVFGDRYEMLAASISAYILRIPITHIAGGEKTVGSLDEGFRHSISKLSNLHFPTMDIYKKRIIQLGENPKTVFNYGSLNLLKIKNNKYIKKNKLEKKLKLKFYEKNLIITYHPETIEEGKTIKNLTILLNSLKKIKNTLMIITSPNADSKGILMIRYLKKYIKQNKLENFLFFESLGSQTYLSLLKIVDGVVGNSSSGISEVPFFGIGTVNIGDRQMGRETPNSVINCEFNENSIVYSINKILNTNFKKKLKKRAKKYGNKNTARKIVRKLYFFNFKKYNKKFFYDLQKNI